MVHEAVLLRQTGLTSRIDNVQMCQMRSICAFEIGSQGQEKFDRLLNGAVE